TPLGRGRLTPTAPAVGTSPTRRRSPSAATAIRLPASITNAASRRSPTAKQQRTNNAAKPSARTHTTSSMGEPARVAVIYYSATGKVHALARALAGGAEEAGAEVRLRHVEELASEQLISQNQYWGRHRSQVADAPAATLDDLDWAEGVAFGTPTRFGNVAAQLKQFIDQAGALWQDGKLADKVGTAFTASQTVHGGQETTILALNNTLYHWGMLILPLGYTVREVFAAGGNPYGASFVTGHTVTGPDDHARAVARDQGQRLARFSSVISNARRHGAFLL